MTQPHYEVKVLGGFSASHRLRGYRGKCESLHGHNWKVEVSVSAPTLNKTGMVADFCVLKKTLSGVLNALDHCYLNDLAYFKKINPTSEHIAHYVFLVFRKKSRIKGHIRVSVWETDTSRASYEEIA